MNPSMPVGPILPSEARVASVLLGCARQGATNDDDFRAGVLEEALLVVRGLLLHPKESTSSFRLTVVVLQELCAYPLPSPEYRGVFYLWKVLQKTGSIPQEPHELWYSLRERCGRVCDALPPSPGTSREGEGNDCRSGSFIRALRLLSHSVRTLSCGFDPVSAFTEAWCKLFGADHWNTRWWKSLMLSYWAA